MTSSFEKQTATFEFERETKGTLVFDEKDPKDNPLIGTLYLRKARLAGQRPQRLTITVEG
jgi:hypothetical protein